MSELQELVDSLAAGLRRAVAIDDQHFHLAVFSSHAQEVDDVRMASILRREAPVDVQRFLLELGIDRATEPVQVPANAAIGMRARCCVPIRFEGLLMGYLWLVEEPTAPDEQEVLLAQRCAADIAPLLYRERMLDDARRQDERALVRRLLHGDADDRRAAAVEVWSGGMLRRADAYAVLLIEVPVEEGFTSRTGAEAGALSGLERVRRVLAPHRGLAGVDGQHGVMIASLDRGKEVLVALDDALERGAWREVPADRWIAVRGPSVPRLEDIPTSYAGACDVASIAAMLPPHFRAPVLDWTKLGAWRTLARVPRDATTRAAIHPALEVVASRSDGPQLLESLETFLEHGGDTTAAARRLHVHRTSLHARLRRIERDTGVDLGDGAQRLDLHIGLRLMRLLGGLTPGEA